MSILELIFGAVIIFGMGTYFGLLIAGLCRAAELQEKTQYVNETVEEGR